MRRLLTALGLALAAVALTPGAAVAHPLGNFTVNTADRLLVHADGVRVTHVVDLAEIPTVQLAQAAAGVDTDRDGALSPAELTAYGARECARTRPMLDVVVDGRPASLRLASSAAVATPGQAGLATTRVECVLETDRRPAGSLAFADAAAPARNGWREVSAASVCGRVVSTDVPAQSPTGLLAQYPEDLLQAPADVTTARLQLTGGGPCATGEGAATGEGPALSRGLDGLGREVTSFLGRPDLTLPFALLSLLVAVGFGAAHALAPGHGKTVMAAYLVGQRGTRRQALQLGAVVTSAHTGSVLALGAAITAGTLAAPEQVLPVTQVVAGLLLAGVGGYLLLLARRRLRSAPGREHLHDHGHPQDDDHAQDHDHDHDGHHRHDHEHPHPLGHRHDHLHPPSGGGEHRSPADPVTVPLPRGALVAAGGAPLPAGRARPATSAVVAAAHSHGGSTHTHAPLPEGPLTWRSLVAMGVAGGLVPSPSALLVLLGAVALGRPAFGVLLVLGYGVGMALTLTAAGLLLLRAQAALDRRGWALGRGRRLGRLLPALTAGLVVVVGAALVLRGLAAA